MSNPKRHSIHEFLRSGTLKGVLSFQQQNVPDGPPATVSVGDSHDVRNVTDSQSNQMHSVQPIPLQDSGSASVLESGSRPQMQLALPPMHASTSTAAAASVSRVTAAAITYAAEVFGINVADEAELLALAVEAHSAPVDLPWLEYTDNEGFLYYYNSRTKETSWEHPATPVYRERLRLKQLELRSQIMSARVLSARASHRSDIDGAALHASGAAAHHQLHYLNIGPAIRISINQHKSESCVELDSHETSQAKDDLHVIASTAQFSSLSQLLYAPKASLASGNGAGTSAAAPIAKVLAIKTSSLDVSINHLESLSGLDAFSGLVQLHVNMNQLTSLQHLNAAPFLLTVLASNNLISSLRTEDVAAMQLHHLDLSNNRITNASALAFLPSLTFLNLSANRISAVTGFRALTNLLSLKIANNCLISLGPSTLAPSLQTLDVHSNGLHDAQDLVSCLRNLTSLHTLIITQNPVEKDANFQVDAVAAAPSLRELNYLVIKQGLREELQLAAVSGIVEDASQRLKLAYLRAVEREQQRLQQCINSTKLKETFYEKAFEGYKKKLESEFGAAIHRVQSLSTEAVASGDYDTARVAKRATAVMHDFAGASSATGDFGRAVASDVFAQSSSASVGTLPVAPPPLAIRSFDASKQAAIFELSSSDAFDDDGADAFPEMDTSVFSAGANLSSSHIPSDAHAAATASSATPRLIPAITFAFAAPAQPNSTAAIESSSSIIATSLSPAAAPLSAQPPRQSSPKPSPVKTLRRQDSAAVSPKLLASPAVEASAPAAAQLSLQTANGTHAAPQQNAVGVSKSCSMM